MGIYRLRPLDGLVSQTGSTIVVLGASGIGTPVSTSQVVASSVAGAAAATGGTMCNWHVVRAIALAWLVTMPVCFVLGALACAALEVAHVKRWFLPYTPELLGAARAVRDHRGTGIDAFVRVVGR